MKNITTQGLKWDLTNDSLKFGELVSTSNVVLSDEVVIETSDFMMFVFDRR